MRWSFRSHETSGSSWQRSFIPHSNQSPIFASKSGNCWKVSQDSLWSGQGNQTRTRCSSWNSSRFNSSSSHAMDCSTCCLHHQSIPHSSGWQDIILAGVQQASFTNIKSIGSFRGKEFWLMFKPPLPPKSFVWGLSLRSITHCCWEHVSSLECTSWLTKVRFSKPEQSLVWSRSSNSMLSSSAKSFLLLTNASLTIKNLKKIALHFRNCSGHASFNKRQRCRTKTSSLWIKGLRSLLSKQAHHSRLHQPRERISNHHHCQRHQHRPQYLS